MAPLGGNESYRPPGAFENKRRPHTSQLEVKNLIFRTRKISKNTVYYFFSVKTIFIYSRRRGGPGDGGCDCRPRHVGDPGESGTLNI